MKKRIVTGLIFSVYACMLLFSTAACGNGGSNSNTAIAFDGGNRFYHMRFVMNGLSYPGKTVSKVYNYDGLLKDNSGTGLANGFADAVCVGTYDNLYRAIDNVCYSGQKGDTVVDTGIRNNNQTVFQRETSGKQIYLYTRTEFKGKAANEPDALSFLKNNSGSHAILSGGSYLQHSYTVTGGVQPTLFEPDAGSYVYKFAKTGFVTFSQIVRLKGAKVKFSDNPDIQYNMYILVSSSGPGGIGDFGFIGTKDKDGGLRICMTAENGVLPEVISYPVPTEVPGEYEYQHDFYMEYTLKPEGYYMTIQNLTEGTAPVTYFNPSVLTETYNRRSLLAGTSFVPDMQPDKSRAARKIWDPDCGAYFRGVWFEDIRIYGEDGAESDFYAWSDTVETAFAYADDGVEYLIDRAGMCEKVNIDYRYDK